MRKASPSHMREPRAERANTAPAPVAIAPDDRRTACRYRTVYRVVKVLWGAHCGIWRIRNISDEGMMLATDEPILVGETLTVELSEHHRLVGQVVWSEAGHCGLALEMPIDSAALLRELAQEQRAGTHRAPRLGVNLPGVAYSEKGMHAIRTTDLSQHGIGFTHSGHFEEGMRVLVMLENGVERRGTVRWADDHRAGLELSEPFACDDLNFCAH